MIRFFVLALAIWISSAAGQTELPTEEPATARFPTTVSPHVTSSTGISTTWNYTTFPPRGIYFGTGFTYSVCGQEYARNITYVQCPVGVRGLTTTWVISFPTTLGYNAVATLQILLCSPNEYTCQNACNFSEAFLGPGVDVIRCSADCCSYDYCRSYHYTYSSPQQFNIPEKDLLDVKVEILPNCTLQDLAPRVKSCVSPVFDAWPFTSNTTCVNTLFEAMRCGVRALSTCRTNKNFTSSLIKLPNGFEISEEFFQNFTDIIQHVVLNPICNGENPLETLLGMGVFTGGFVDIGRFQRFGSQQFCYLHFTSRIVGWVQDLMEVLLTSNNRTAMCGVYKRVVYNFLNISTDTCKLNDTINNLFTCDSIVRNQVRALHAQLREFAPMLIPNYCDGIPPTPEPTPPPLPRDMPLLPSCTLRKTILETWTCEAIFTKSTPYETPDACKTNVNRLMNCVANRFEECARGYGPNAFDKILRIFRRYPYTFDQLISAIRSQAQSVTTNNYYWNPRNMFCSSANLGYLSSYDPTYGLLSTMCGEGIYKELINRTRHLYYEYVGARNSADICRAYRSMRDWVSSTVKQRCDLEVLTYLIPDSNSRYILRNFAHILTDILDELEISACPIRRASDNSSLIATDWLRSYAKWKTVAFPRWQAAFSKYLQESQEEIEDFDVPQCLGLTAVTCRNEGMKRCNTDEMKCEFCYCEDHKYRDLAGKLLRKWQEDYRQWEEFFTKWEDIFEDFSDGF